MLGNCEKMVLISSPSNQWTQQNNQQIDVQRGGGMASVAAAPPPSQKVATFSQQQQQNQQQNQQQGGGNSHQEPMRCPRCDSSNTKFCYYNNYSLSQPRHFCKACKRYWTRGGTLRNVPVGGGCRKNKRVKRPHHLQTNSSASNNSSSSINNNNNHLNSNNNNNLHETSVNSGSVVGGHIHDLISSASNPLFYGLPTTNHNHNLMNFPFSRYDLQNPSQINALGLGFSSGLVHNGDLRNGLSMNLHHINNCNNNNNNDNHTNNNKQIFQDLISSNNPLLSNYANTTTSTTTTSSTTPPTISSLLASNFHMKGNGNNFQTLLPSYEEGLHMKGNGQGGMFGKEVKMELEGQNRSLDHHWSAPSQNQMDHGNNMGSSSSDPSVIWGSGPNLGAWLDSSNNNHHHLGSSVPSLI